MRLSHILLVPAVVIAGFTCPILHGADPASLDPGFNGTGVATTNFSSNGDSSSAVAVQGDGRIVTAGQAYDGANYNFALARYNTNGTPDTAFNGTGRTSTVLSAGFSSNATSMALQGNGKIVVAGSANDGANYDFAVVRYNADGSLDTTFNGTGKVLTPVGTGISIATGMAVQGDGKIVVAGFAQDASGTNFDFALVRYHGDVATGAPGTLDTTFNGTGKVLLAVGTGDSNINAVALQSDGKIVVAGNVTDALGNTDSVVARFNANGTLDTTFNGTGIAISALSASEDSFSAVALQSDGKIVAGGYASNGTNHDFAVARYTSAGLLDTTFNGTGKVLTPIGSGDDEMTGIAVQGDGKIVAAGTAAVSIDGGSVALFGVARYNGSGSLDTTFSSTGTTTIGVGSGSNGVSGLALQGDGKILVTGSAGTPAVFATLRLVGGSGASPLDTWRQTWYGTMSNSGPAANDADPYHTGVSNLLVFGLFGPAQNPVLVNTGMLPKPQIIGGNYVAQFTQPAGVSGITYGAQWRPDLALGTWLALPETGAGSVHIFSIPVGANPRGFMRFTATSP